MLFFDWKQGDWVLFRKTKFSPQPGPRARNIHPSGGGDDYAYTVDKFRVVVQVEGNQLILLTRKGKRQRVAANDPRIRKPNFWERRKYRARFTSVEKAGENIGHSA